MATLLAFKDWLTEHDLPIEEILLTACSVDLSILDDADEEQLRDIGYYKAASEIFAKIWKFK